jgi:hypothetical protein
MGQLGKNKVGQIFECIIHIPLAFSLMVKKIKLAAPSIESFTFRWVDWGRSFLVEKAQKTQLINKPKNELK